MSKISKEYREEITRKIIDALKKGTAPWQKEWSSNYSPFNAVTGKPYRGVNSIILSVAGDELSANGKIRWATRKQAESRGWSIKLGEKPTQIYFLLLIDKKDKAGKVILNKWGEPAQKSVMKTFEVYHESQIEGIPPCNFFKKDVVINNQVIEEIIFNSSARIFESGNEAYYSPRNDLIRMPFRSAFADSEGYYSTLLHELAHWTGHETRLNRFFSWSSSSKDYAREELVAEIASMFLSVETGLKQTEKHFANHASYVASWISLLESDPNAIFTASNEAKKAADFIMSFRDEEFYKAKAAS